MFSIVTVCTGNICRSPMAEALLRSELTDAGLAQRVDDDLAGAVDRLAGHAGEQIATVGVGDPLRRIGDDPARAGDDGAGGKLQLAPPLDVGEVTEGAAHGDAGALVHLGARVREDGDLDVEQRALHLRAEQRLVALVVGVGDEGDAGGQQFGAGRLDVDVLAVARVEGDAVIGARVVACLELSLGDGRLERDVPQARRLLLVGLAALQIAQKGLLGDGARTLVDRAVGDVPVDADAEAAEEILERLLVLDGEHVTQLDEVLTTDRFLVGGLDALALGTLQRRGVVGDVGLCGVTAHAVVVLHTTLGGQAVVVPTDRVENLTPLHALVARHAVGVGVAEHVTHVQ